jgi:hypothetical protein
MRHSGLVTNEKFKCGSRSGTLTWQQQIYMRVEGQEKNNECEGEGEDILTPRGGVIPKLKSI